MYLMAPLANSSAATCSAGQHTPPLVPLDQFTTSRLAWVLPAMYRWVTPNDERPANIRASLGALPTVVIFFAALVRNVCKRPSAEQSISPKSPRGRDT